MKREAYFDNARLILIFLVVFGHIIQPFKYDATWINTLYTWIYTFHMPAFIFTAGFFAKGLGNKKYIMNLINKILVPYFIFQLLYTGFYFFIGKEGWQSGLFSPQWSLWFLFSLFSWHLLLYWFKKLPPAAGVILSLAIGVFIGYIGDIGHTFSLSRTFVFFPFFLVGYWLTKEHVMFLKHRIVKSAALLIMVTLFVFIYVAPEINTGWLLASKSYGDMGMPESGGLTRLLVYMTSSVMAASVLAWIPERQFKLTKLGERTLYVYLLHGFFIQFFRQADWFHVENPLHLIGLGLLSGFIVIVLSSKPVIRFSKPLIEGQVSRIRNIFQRHRHDNAS